MDPAPLVQLVPLWGWVPPRSHRHSLTINIHRPSVTYESSWFTLVSLELYYFSFSRFYQNFPKPKNCNCFHHRKDKRFQEHCEGQGLLFAPKNSCCTKCVYQLHNFRVNRSTASQTHLFSAATKDIWFQVFLCENHPGKEMPQQPFPQKTLPKLHPLLSGSYRTSASGTLVPSPKIRARAWDWSIKNTGKFSHEKSRYACLNSWKSPRKKIHPTKTK